MKEIKFNYCNRFTLHFIWYGTTLAGFAGFIILFRNWLGTVGIEPNGRFISEWWFEHKTVFFLVLFGIPCVAYCLIFLTSMAVAVVLLNKTGKCEFYDDFCVLYIRKKVRIDYKDIKSIRYVRIFTSPAYLGRTPHKLTIKAGNKKVKVNMSLKESWFNRKKKVTLEVLYGELFRRYQDL